MNLKIKLILIVAISATLFLLTLIHVGKQKEATPPPRVITLSNTDTIYQEIEILKFKSNIIIKTHETKINNYRHATTTDKVQLFADRINRQ
jgi:hypothetical protein